MLGRFRMTVADCLWEYERLGDRVFGRPRKLNQLAFPFTSRTKYNAANLEKVFDEVSARRGEVLEGGHQGSHELPLPKGICQM